MCLVLRWNDDTLRQLRLQGQLREMVGGVDAYDNDNDDSYE